MIGKASPQDWLATDGLLAQFAIRRSTAVQRYKQFIAEGIDRESIWKDLNRQVFLGDDQFVSRMQVTARGLSNDVNIPRVQRRPPAPPLQAIAEAHESRNNAIVAAHATGAYSYQQIAEFFGLHFTTIGRIVSAAKASSCMQ
jgi:putative transposase